MEPAHQLVFCRSSRHTDCLLNYLKQEIAILYHKILIPGNNVFSYLRDHLLFLFLGTSRESVNFFSNISYKRRGAALLKRRVDR